MKMNNKKTIDKMRENILNGTSNFVGINPKYCDHQEYCKVVKQITDQYNQVVKQNVSLQTENRWYKDQQKKDNDYLIKLEEANMLLEQDVETLKRQVEALKERYEGNEN